MIHLDSSFLIRSLTPGTDEDRVLRQWVSGGEHLTASVVAWTEFLCGPVSTEAVSVVAAFVGEPEPFDAAAAPVAAQLFNAAGRRRGSLPDCMIAAAALHADAELATADLADFRRFEPLGLRLATT